MWRKKSLDSNLFEIKGGQIPLGAPFVYNTRTSIDQGYKPEWDVEKAHKEGFENSIWVFKCIDVIASNQAKLPMIFREENSPTGTIVDDDPILKIFNTKANEGESSYNFRYRISAILMLSKSGVFIEVIRDRLGRPKALQILPPAHTSIVRDKESFIKGYKVHLSEVGGGTSKILKPHEVIWVRRPHPLDPYSSQTPLETVELSVEIDLLAQLYNRNFLKNDGRPGGLLVSRSEVSEEDRRELEHKFKGSIERSGHVALVESEGFQYLDLGGSPRDAAYSTMRAISKEEILAAFGVPESIIGNASNRTFSNASQEAAVFWNETMAPHLDLLARAFDEIDESYYVDYDTSSVEPLEIANQIKSNFYVGEFTSGLISLNEYREFTGKSRVESDLADMIISGSGMPLGSTKQGPLEVDGVEIDPGVSIEDQATSAFHEDPVAEFDPDTGSFVEAGTVQGVSNIEMSAEEIEGLGTEEIPEESEVEGKKSYPLYKSKGSVANLVTVSDVVTMLNAQQGTVFNKLYGDQFLAGLLIGERSDFSSIVSLLDLNNVTEQIMYSPLHIVYQMGRDKLSKLLSLHKYDESETKGHIREILNIIKSSNVTTYKELEKVFKRAVQVSPDNSELSPVSEKSDVLNINIPKIFERAGHQRAALFAHALNLSAYNYGLYTAGVTVTRNFGIPVKKKWINIGNERTRKSHKAIHGTEKNIFDPWELPDGKVIRFPGDPAASVEHTVNCRCRMSLTIG